MHTNYYRETVRIHDRMGFHYDAEFQHSPQHGFSTAYYRGTIIGQASVYPISKPFSSDNDQVWEEYEQQYSEWKDEVKSRLVPICKEYFDKMK